MIKSHDFFLKRVLLFQRIIATLFKTLFVASAYGILTKDFSIMRPSITTTSGWRVYSGLYPCCVSTILLGYVCPVLANIINVFSNAYSPYAPTHICAILRRHACMHVGMRPKQCDQIWRFFALWATIQSLWQQLF